MITAQEVQSGMPGVSAVLAAHPEARRDSLIPILQEVQEREGYLSPAAVRQIARHLHLPASKVFGVATFYNQFRFKPVGRHHIQVCRGTACHVKGSAAVLDALTQELTILAGDTTPDGDFSIEVVACIGACGLAPLLCVNGAFYGDMCPKKTRRMLEDYRERLEGDEE